MTELIREERLFHNLSKKVLAYIEKKGAKVSILKNKGETPTNYVTQTDIDIEKLILHEIQLMFPQDKIRAEESFPNVDPMQGRVWLIDPICGTSNFARGFSNFATNIALAENGELQASCVVDHSRKEYIWTVGKGQIHVNTEIVKPIDTPGIKIELDLGSVPRCSDIFLRKRYMRMVSKLAIDSDYNLVSSDTSLAFAYTALGRIDAYVSPSVKDLHVAAANFLLSQIRGVYTDIHGEKWTLYSSGVIAARTKQLHQSLLDLLK